MDCHWYSGVVPTVMAVRTAATTLVGVHAPPESTVPHEVVATTLLVSVAKFTITELPTRSVRYG